ncbi:MAG: Flp family type IVb pilin [Pseudomonadota bacterium]|nr:Flp family type IVb pilin [Pseudomonadota bacterium]
MTTPRNSFQTIARRTAGAFAEDRSGLTAMHYALIAGLIALVIIPAVARTGEATNDSLTYMAGAVHRDGDGPSSDGGTASGDPASDNGSASSGSNAGGSDPAADSGAGDTGGATAGSGAGSNNDPATSGGKKNKKKKKKKKKN